CLRCHRLRRRWLRRRARRQLEATSAVTPSPASARTVVSRRCRLDAVPAGRKQPAWDRARARAPVPAPLVAAASEVALLANGIGFASGLAQSLLLPPQRSNTR